MATVNAGFSGDKDRRHVQHRASPISIYEDPNSLPAVPKHQFAKAITDVPGEDGTAGITLVSLKTTHFYDEIEHCAGKEQECPVMEVENPYYEYGEANRVLNSVNECRSRSAKDCCIKVNLRWILVGSFLIGCVISLIVAVVSLNSTRVKSPQSGPGMLSASLGIGRFLATKRAFRKDIKGMS